MGDVGATAPPSPDGGRGSYSPSLARWGPWKLQPLPRQMGDVGATAPPSPDGGRGSYSPSLARWGPWKLQSLKFSDKKFEKSKLTTYENHFQIIHVGLHLALVFWFLNIYLI